MLSFLQLCITYQVFTVIHIDDCPFTIFFNYDKHFLYYLPTSRDSKYARSRHFVFWFTTSEMWTTILKAFFKKFLLNFCRLCQFAWKSDWFLLPVTKKKTQPNSTGIVFQVGYLTPLTLPCIFHCEWRQKINKHMNGVLLSKQNPRMFWIRWQLNGGSILKRKFRIF